MRSTSLEILKKFTRPKSQAEIQAFIVARHGTLVRDNASADLTALDQRARQSIPGQANKTAGLD